MLLIIYLRMTQNLVSDTWRSTFEIGAAQLCYVTEIAPKSPFLCVNRSPNRYDFRGGAKTIRHNVNIALVTVPTHNVIFRCKDLSLEAGWKPTESRQLCSTGATESNSPWSRVSLENGTAKNRNKMKIASVKKTWGKMLKCQTFDLGIWFGILARLQTCFENFSWNRGKRSWKKKPMKKKN